MSTVLTRINGGEKEICTFITKSAGQRVFLGFDKMKDKNGCDFKTAKNAWWHWYRFKETYPEQAVGYVKVEIR